MMTGDAQVSNRMQPGTKRRALFVFGVIAAVVALVGVFWPDHSRRTPIETYARQGTRQGAALLKQEIDELSPRGSDPGPAVQRLGTLGLSCAAPAAISGDWTCVMRRPTPDRHMLTIDAAIRVERGLVAETTTRFSEQSTR
ncbi:MAG: hypothetical protein JWR10_2331 [Rubritepida sp.]|nr:hypothetical protein [Rubritepida sp.]